MRKEERNTSTVKPGQRTEMQVRPGQSVLLVAPGREIEIRGLASGAYVIVRTTGRLQGRIDVHRRDD